MVVSERLAAFREAMKKYGLDAFYVPTNDYHHSEYVDDFFKCREYLSGFTGSAGTLVVTLEEAGLWTDGRYFLQAERQLADTGITLYRMGESGTPDVLHFLESRLSEGKRLGMDGKVVSAAYARQLQAMAKKKGALVESSIDLPGEVWMDRPPIHIQPTYSLPIETVGEGRAEKLSRLDDWMKEKGIDLFVLTSLDDIAWLLNIRGDDIHCSPVFMSYLVVSSEKRMLYARESAFSDELKQDLNNDRVILKKYDEVYHDLSHEREGIQIAMDLRVVNYALLESVPGRSKILDVINPTQAWKAKKNSREIAGERAAHIKDGVALTRFLYWLDQRVEHMKSAESVDLPGNSKPESENSKPENGNSEPESSKPENGKPEPESSKPENSNSGNSKPENSMSEISLSRKLEEFRAEMEGYLGPSFDPIAAYGEHGAIVHYSATEETDAVLAPGTFLLLDTGAHYTDGTTDVTRTIFLGNNINQEQKKHYTAVLRGNLRLAAAKFRQGCTGVTLDGLARGPLWEIGCDYQHGTGHGVGHLLNVHEGPNNISYHISRQRGGNAAIEVGMITSNEPGVYLEGRYGIRLENLILCVEDEETEFGKFNRFETLTMAPFDRKAIDTKWMTAEEVDWLNEYHETVFRTISPYLKSEEREWLRKACEKIRI